MQDRLNYRVWDKENKEYTTDSRIFLSPNGTVRYIEDSYWYDNVSEYYDVEFCTGLKDKNSKLIYEGDIIEDKYGEKHIVKFGKHTVTIPVGYENGETECWGMYLSKFTYGFIYLQEQCDNLNPDNEYLIIGNIHENPELSEEYKKNTQS